MELRQLIGILEKYGRDHSVRYGFGSPHSYRGDYSELAFDPIEDTTVGEMLDHAKSAVGSTYTGWKGGEFTMGLDTPTFVSPDCGGHCNEEISVYMIGFMLQDTSVILESGEWDDEYGITENDTPWSEGGG